MESFCANSAKSFIGRNVNLHLKDGAVIVNVQLTAVRKISARNNLLEYALSGNRKTGRLPLRNVAWAELIDLNFIPEAA